MNCLQCLRVLLFVITALLCEKIGKISVIRRVTYDIGETKQ